MDRNAMYYILFAILSLISPGRAVHLRSAGRWSRSFAVRRSTEDLPTLAMGMSPPQRGSYTRADAVNVVEVDRSALDRAAGSVVRSSFSSALSSSSPITTTSTITTDLTVTLTSTITATRTSPTGRYAGGEKWLPKGGSIDVRKWVSPETPHRYTSNGTCVDMKDYKKRSASYILSYLKLAEGLRCKFYLLPNCNKENVLLMEGDLHLGGFWNATQIWNINIISSFQCWPKQCYQPDPSFNYSIESRPTFTCTERVPSTALPIGFESKHFRQTVLASSSSAPYNNSRSSSYFPSGDISTLATSSSSRLPSETMSATPAISSSSMANRGSSSVAATSTTTVTTTYVIGLDRRTANGKIGFTRTVTRTVTHTITEDDNHALATTTSASSTVSTNHSARYRARDWDASF